MTSRSVIFCRWGSIAWSVEQDGRFPGGLREGLGQVLLHLPGILVEQRVMLHYQEAVVVLLQDGHELEAGRERKFRSNLLVSNLGSYCKE